MAVLAAPLVIPFSQAVPALAGLTGILGMTALSEKVNEYIQENPEESMKIFQMIMPAQGIANALKNKSGEDVEEVQESEIFMNKEKISLEDLDEMTDEEAADLPDEDKAELMKQAGKRRDRELSIATSEKLGLSGPGKEKKDMEYDIDKRYDEGGVEDAPKSKFDYTKFFRKRRADGGAIGIEVLFEEKMKNGGRIGFDNGGQTAPAGTFTLTDYVNFLNVAEDFNRLYDKGEEVVGEVGEFVEQMGDKEYDDYTGKELIRERELEGKLENLEDEFDKTEDDYFDYSQRELPADEEAMGAYARQLINDLNQRDVTLGTLAEIAGLKKGGRVGFNLGGLLTGQAKSIYDNMTAAGYFTEDEIRNAITNAGYEIPGASTTAPAPDTGIINQQSTPQRNDRVIGLQETFTKDLSGDPRFNYLEPTAQANKYRFDRSVEPREGLLGFFDGAMNKMKESKFFQPKVRGTLGTRIANQPKLPLPGAIAAYSLSPFNPDSRNYNPLLEGQLNFLEGLDNMIGRDQQSGLLKYGSGSVLAGKNVISGFGSNNYEVALNKYLQRMNRYENPTKKQQEKIAQAQAELAAEKERQIREAKTKAQALAAIQSQGKMDYNPNIHGPVNYGKDSQGNQSFDFGGGFGIGSDGGPVSNRSGRGRQGYGEGGLASMFVEKR